VNIATIVLDQAKLRPNAPAIIASHKGRDRVMTFRELANASARVAVQLCEAGLAPGSAVLLLVPMSPELYAVLVGLFRAGFVPTVLDPSAGRKHIDRCCELNPPAGFIGVPEAHALRLLSGRIRDIPHKFCVGAGWPFGRRLEVGRGKLIDERVADLPSEHPALMIFTSGSTGLPKAVVRSHGFLLAQHHVLEDSIQLQAGQIDLTTLPVFVLANLGSGVASVIPDCDLRKPGNIDAVPVLAQVERLGITRTAASPAFIECLLQAPAAGVAGAGLRQVFTGGAPVFPRLLQRVKEIWPTCEPAAVYGSTEAEPIADLPLRDILISP
jgi:acyl-coenzyme A synthetase/AMP-(fatty) acid ligase